MTMGHDDYIAVPLDDGPGGYAEEAELKRRRTSRREAIKRTALLALLTVVIFAMGFGAGSHYGQAGEGRGASTVEEEDASSGLLPAHAFVPDCELSSG